MATNYNEQAICGRESLFRQKLNQLRNTGEIRRMAVASNQAGLKEIEQSIYLKNTDTTLAQSDPRRLEKLALLDSLTELYNHSTTSRLLKDEVRRAQRYKNDLSVLVITIDSMHAIAKQNSPFVCDSILKATAQILMRCIRDIDIPGRYNRDHLILVCPETEPLGAACLAERLCNQIKAEDISDMEKTWHITASIGISTFPQPAQNDEQLIHLALQSLQLAEQKGGNTYVSPKSGELKMYPQ